MLRTRDVMSSPVLTVGPDDSVASIAALLADCGISGVPVVEQGRVVGLVNEGELVQRHEIGTQHRTPPCSWWERLRAPDAQPTDYVRAHGRRARDVMTRHVQTADEDTPLPTLAALFASRALRRIVVMRGEQLVGVVTRADLVAALVRHATPDEAPLSDEGIRNRLLAELEHQAWWRPGESSAYVRDGVVHYLGSIVSDDERRAARVAAENVPGVREVQDRRLRWSAWQAMT
jgi:CBS domain-containing protein